MITSFVMELVSTEPDGGGQVAIMLRFPSPMTDVAIPIDGIPLLISELKRLLRHSDDQQNHKCQKES